MFYKEDWKNVGILCSELEEKIKPDDSKVLWIEYFEKTHKDLLEKYSEEKKDGKKIAIYTVIYMLVSFPFTPYLYENGRIMIFTVVIFMPLLVGVFFLLRQLEISNLKYKIDILGDEEVNEVAKRYFKTHREEAIKETDTMNLDKRIDDVLEKNE